MMTRLLALASLLLVAACSHYSLIQPGPQTVTGGLTVKPDVAWSKALAAIDPQLSASSRVETWTIDGQELDAVTFFTGIPDGQALFVQSEQQQQRQAPLPKFRSSMTASDVMELLEDTLRKVTQTALTSTRNLRATKFDNLDGFRFDMSYVLKDEVDRELTAVGAVYDGKLYLMFYQGTKLYHYGRHLPAFEALVSSAHFTKS